MRPPLIRSADRVIAGVCAGLAQHLGMRVGTVRVIMAAGILFGGAGAILYAWLWLLVPSAEDAQREESRSFDPRNVAENFARNVAPWLATRPGTPRPPATGAAPAEPAAKAPAGATAGPGPDPEAPPRATPPRAGLFSRPGLREAAIGAALLLAGLAVVLQLLGVNISWQTWVPLLAIAAGAVLSWIQLDESRRDMAARGTGSLGFLRLAGGLTLVAIGIFSLLGALTGFELMWQSLLATLAILIGLALVVAPWAYKYWRELGRERSARAREAERADIAAHLHDSVLQTLALIQNRAANESDVLRLARAQERELREWLHRDREHNTGKLADLLRRIGAEIEDAHGHPVEFVTVGDADMNERLDPLLQAAREAIQNAARHAGGPISVYLECTPGRAELFIRDRGPGFDPDTIPADRLGVRESLIGRMERHGGSARIRNTGNGTEVALIMTYAEEATAQP
ncbi:ATP-binding protein [Mycetocola spongiae]|uniref:ATP-binding protein n=1 Tax=Mycetocola spongiae TaxID=2859226 RepID=UPI001CF277FE|nr:ATP-binding protein [Mycetocola spongiae]UCR90108.1 PspC domain-containing protein [Mycetocola spongiae]